MFFYKGTVSVVISLLIIAVVYILLKIQLKKEKNNVSTTAVYKYNWLVSIFRAGYKPATGAYTSARYTQDRFWHYHFLDASTLLNGYNTDSSVSTKYIGKVPTEDGEIALEVGIDSIENANIKDIQKYLKNNVMIRLTSLSEETTDSSSNLFSRDYKVVGIRLKEGLSSKFIYLSDS